MMARGPGTAPPAVVSRMVDATGHPCHAVGMMTAEWDAEAVLAAANAWVWIPDGALEVRTDDYLVVRFPDYLGGHTATRVFGSERDPAELVDEVTAVSQAWGRDRMEWQVSDATRPIGLEAELLARGATVQLRLDVLALPLDASGPPETTLGPGGANGVTVRRVVDEAGVRDALPIAAEAFGDPLPAGGPTREQVAADLSEVEQGLVDDSVGRVVADVDGEPAATGGWTLAGPVCRLWGAGTRTHLRRRGAYRAVLHERLRIGAAAGATLALTRGAVDTSAPTLRRAGFVGHGEERVLVLGRP